MRNGKVYRITFNTYTNSLKDTVARYKESHPKSGATYLHCHQDTRGSDGYLMILTDDLSRTLAEFQGYGDGIKHAEYIGTGFYRDWEEEDKREVDRE